MNTPAGIEYTHTSSNDVALRFSGVLGPDASDPQRRLFVTPGSIEATEIGEATTYYAEALAGDKTAQELTEEEHVTLAALGIINSRLHGRNRASEPYAAPQVEVEEGAQRLGAPFRNSEATLIIDAIRFTLMARAATAADAQDALIEQRQATIERAETAHTHTATYRLPEPPPEQLIQSPQLKQWLAAQRQQIKELTRSKAAEATTIGERDRRLKDILGALGLPLRKY